MIDLTVGDCRVTILPVVSGLVSEADRVRELYGKYDSYGISIGIEGLMAIRDKAHLDNEFEVSELDLAYAHRMEEITKQPVEIPSPAMCVLVDLCTRDNRSILALDMNDNAFTELYCDTVGAWDFVKEHRLAKKGLKRKFKSTTPEEFAVEWDDYINEVKGYRRVSEKREAYIADRIREAAAYKDSLLVVIEYERAKGIAARLSDA